MCVFLSACACVYVSVCVCVCLCVCVFMLFFKTVKQIMKKCIGGEIEKERKLFVTKKKGRKKNLHDIQG